MYLTAFMSFWRMFRSRTRLSNLYACSYGNLIRTTDDVLLKCDSNCRRCLNMITYFELQTMSSENVIRIVGDDSCKRDSNGRRCLMETWYKLETMSHGNVIRTTDNVLWKRYSTCTPLNDNLLFDLMTFKVWLDL